MISRFVVLLLAVLLTLLSLVRVDVILPEWYNKANPTPKKVMLKPTVAAKKPTPTIAAKKPTPTVAAKKPTPTINSKKIVKKNN